jgi:hypothetical protein
MPHSTPSGYLRCTSVTTCISPIIKFESLVYFASPSSYIQTIVETKKVRISLDFPTFAEVDGSYLDIAIGEIDIPAVRYIHPMGSDNYLRNGDNASFVPAGPAKEQYISIDWNLFTKRPFFNGTYDPGVLIELLFDLEKEPSSVPEAAIEQARLGLTIGLAVGLSVFAVVAVTVTVVMVKVVPYMARRRREEKEKVPQSLDESGESARESQRWASGSKPHAEEMSAQTHVDTRI